MPSFHQDDGEVDIHAPEGSHAIELFDLRHRSEVEWSSEIPVVVDVLGLPHQLIPNRSFTGATNGELLSPDYDGLVGGTMTS